MLTDLKNINTIMIAMGALLPGLPSPAMVPKDWAIMITDLQDCFFTIPLHPDDRQRFAFSIPSINNQSPAQRYQWKILPKGMMNSPMVCQFVVDKILQPIRLQFPEAYLICFMDDILLASPSESQLSLLGNEVITNLTNHGLLIAEDKLQHHSPFKYLGYLMDRSAVKPRKLSIRKDNLQTLNDFQKLLGDINWL